MPEPREILQAATTIAVVGASRSPAKAAHRVPAQLQEHGWRIIPVNPSIDELFGEPAYPSLTGIADRVDIVNVFRPAADAPAVVRDAIAIGAGAVWLQLGIVSPQARAIAQDAGLTYLEDRCIGVERATHGLSKRPDGS